MRSLFPRLPAVTSVKSTFHHPPKILHHSLQVREIITDLLQRNKIKLTDDFREVIEWLIVATTVFVSAKFSNVPSGQEQVAVDSLLREAVLTERVFQSD